MNEFEARKFKNLFGVKEITNEEKKLITFTLRMTLNELVPRKIKNRFNEKELKEREELDQTEKFYLRDGAGLDLVVDGNCRDNAALKNKGEFLLLGK